MRVALAQINPIIGSLKYNLEKISHYIDEAKKKGAELVVFPEMTVCGYPPEDLLLLPSFVESAEKALISLGPKTKDIAVVVGGIRKNPALGEKNLFNTAAIYFDGKLLGFQDKSLLPEYDVFYERRYFEPAAKVQVWNILGKKIAVTICEDIWQHADEVKYSNYLRDPVLELKNEKIDLLVNLSASPYFIERQQTRYLVCKRAAETLQCPLLFCNQIGGNDGLIFDGSSLVVDEKGEILQQGVSFKEDLLLIDLNHRPSPSRLSSLPIEDLFNALVLGLRDYFHKLGFTKACFGISGGIDSAVVACIAKEALGEENLLALMLPSRFTSKESLRDTRRLIDNTGIPYKEISIEKPFKSFLSVLKPSFGKREFDITEENLQARVRATILMAFSNKFGYIVLGTGNKSEMAMGYSTLYGDMCGGLGVLSDVSKEWVYKLADFINSKKETIPSNIIQKAPTAELRKGQKDTDSLPDYSIVDAVLKGYVEEHLSPEEIAEKNKIDFNLVKDLVRRIHLNEHKRRQAPPGIRVTRKAFSVGRRFPIVQHWNMGF